MTTVFLDLSFAAERWLRHKGRLARNSGVTEKVLSSLSSRSFLMPADCRLILKLLVFFAVAGTVGLICLSIFDTLHHPRMHDGFLLIFLCVSPCPGSRDDLLIIENRAGYIISAIFVCAEYQRLGIHFRQHRVLRRSFWLKLVFILVEGRNSSLPFHFY